MPSIRRQLVQFALVLAVLYAIGFIAGTIIDAKPHGADVHETATETHPPPR